MFIDELVLSAQRSIDRLISRIRRGVPHEPSQQRLLVIQIDGLSRTVLEKALAAGHMPFVKHLLNRHGYRLQPMAVGLPTSTPSFQMAAMYGVSPDIPGFHYFDRERQADVHFPRPGHAAQVEAKHADGRPGILQGGSAYGCVFTGAAENNLFTLATLTRPSGRGLLAGLSPFIVVAWVSAKCMVRTFFELTRSFLPFTGRRAGERQDWRWLKVKICYSVWMRAFFTLAGSRDLYAGLPAVYVNYLDYDEASHKFGPSSRQALVSLRRIDRSMRQLWSVTRRVPEHRYDLYVLADHGQAACKPYPEITGGQRFEQWIFEHLLNGRPAGPQPQSADIGLLRGIRRRRAETKEIFQHFMNYVNEDFFRRSDPEAHEQDGIRVIAAGPNAFLYVLGNPQPLDIEALDRLLPGVPEKLSQSPGIGYVLARSATGPLCFWRGRRYQLGKSSAGPFTDRPDAALVVQGIHDLMRMPSAGDLVIYGTDAAQGHVSFIPEFGTHAGPTAEELHTFIIHPEHVSLPSPITHPIQLYDHFIRYQQQRLAKTNGGSLASSTSSPARA